MEVIILTANQINYAKLEEERRHNVEQEVYNSRMAAVAERNAETSWQNVLVSANAVSVNAAGVSETMRHNQVAEYQNEQHLVNESGNTASGFFGNIGKFIGSLIPLLT